jgi:hypothetical protein
LQTQFPHWQLELQVCVPLVHDIVAFGLQPTAPEQADHAFQAVPALLHLRVCVPDPQFPQV